MAFASVDQARANHVRFTFGNSVISMAIAANTTLEDIARTLGDLPRRPRGAPVAIDVTLAAAPGRFEEIQEEDRGPIYRRHWDSLRL